MLLGGKKSNLGVVTTASRWAVDGEPSIMSTVRVFFCLITAQSSLALGNQGSMGHGWGWSVGRAWGHFQIGGGRGCSGASPSYSLIPLLFMTVTRLLSWGFLLIMWVWGAA